ncbi:hypothetical protein IWW33_004784 [Pseudomonas sp. BG2dil]|nr:hypothetical protein [Pseudomonas sp. M2]
MPGKDVCQREANVATSTQDTDLHQAATLGERLDILGEVGFTYKVDDDIDTLPISVLPDDLG